MRLGAQASVFCRLFLLQPRPIDDVYRWVRIDFGVRCLYACRNRSMLSGKAQKAARCSAPSIDQPGEHSRYASVACLRTVRTSRSLLLKLLLDRRRARDGSYVVHSATSLLPPHLRHPARSLYAVPLLSLNALTHHPLAGTGTRRGGPCMRLFETCGRPGPVGSIFSPSPG